MNIGEINLGFPCEIAMFFSGNFLNKNPSTSNYKLDLPDNNTKINWKKDGIPVLFCAISDFKFLK